MTHITQSQKQQIADLRDKGVSFVRIAQQTGIPMGTCKTLFYKDRPATTSSFKSKDGKFKSTAPRSGPGRRPVNGIEAASDKQRAALYRARRKAHLDSLVLHLPGATDLELSALLANAIRSGDNKATKAIISTLHGRYAAIL